VKSKPTKAINLPKLYGATRKEARYLLRSKFRALANRHRLADAGVGKAATAASAALRRVLGRDKKYEATIKSLVAASSKEVLELERTEAKLGGALSREMALGLLSGSGIRDIGGSIGGVVGVTMAAAKDTRTDLRAPPYNDVWTDAEGGRHQQQIVFSNKSTGRFGFGYTIGKEGGSAYCGAGVEVLFMRDAPGFPPGQGPAGLAQIRTFTPYGYIWRDLSYLGPAHQHAGFGVLVWSRSLNGGPTRTDQDHEYWIWQDGTSWYEEHTNPSHPNQDFDNALLFGDQAPYFPINPGRIYGAWIWCFGSGDAHGADVTSAGFAQALIDATARWIVIGQQ